jgi:hypothetical protein
MYSSVTCSDRQLELIWREFANDQALDIGPRGLIVRLIGAVIADLGVGEDDNLPCVGGICRNFLVTGKGSIKNNFALAFTWVSMAVPTEDAPVFEREDRLHRLSEEWIQPIQRRASCLFVVSI